MESDLYLQQFKLGPMENFVYVLGSKSTREVTLIDPAWEIEFILNYLNENDLKLQVKIPDGLSPNDLLGFLANKGTINHFVEVVPTANDIFIQTINAN